MDKMFYGLYSELEQDDSEDNDSTDAEVYTGLTVKRGIISIWMRPLRAPVSDVQGSALSRGPSLAEPL